MKQQEQIEWDDVNKLLQHHGFKPVFFADPVENRSLPELVLLDKKSATEVRATIRMMLTDSERRQALIQEVVKSNNQLKEEGQAHMRRAAKQAQRIIELETLLDQVKTRVQELEDRYLGTTAQQHSYSQQLQNGREEAERRIELLQLKLRKEREEAAQIKKKLHFTVTEEEQRLARQDRTFQNICRKLFQSDSAADQRVMDVIDYYETKLSRQLEELRSAGEGDRYEAYEKPKANQTSPSGSSSFKVVLQTFQEQQRESGRQVQELKKEVARLKQELDARPTVKEMKSYKHKLRRLEGLNRNTNTRFSSSEMIVGGGEPSGGCGLCVRYRHLLSEIAAAVADPKAPSRLCKPAPSSLRSDPADFQSLPVTLEERLQQLRLLKDLQRSINKLSAKLLSWQPQKIAAGDEAKVEEMMMLVDAMLENSAADDEQKLRSPTRYTLTSMVSHFQKLFDVRSLNGVYPCMNAVYTRLEEMTNAMRNLKDVLDLESTTSTTEVVNHVAELVSSNVSAAPYQELLGEADLSSIIHKVKQHDEFFPVFHALIKEMLRLLDVNHLDDIVPALKSLKQSE